MFVLLARNSNVLLTFRKMNNPLVHELTTGPEIIEAIISTPPTSTRLSSEKVDVVVAGVGTGGTITGISRAIKKTHNPNCVIVGIDPVCTFILVIMCQIFTAICF
jgi:cystathionine beta-synthase